MLKNLFRSSGGTGRIGLTLYLQSLLWLGEGGFRDRQQLQARVDEVKTQNLQLMERNRILRAEVTDLKNGMEALRACTSRSRADQAE